ncbi:hypothetical protein [Sphingomonas sp. BK580]|uniref:hypothetical protein n=1 Tax=Sphingomonas sp. BK580 TaxID=2586972 RepID=UPI001617F2E6|nr:hypothetical protein [Sphingomonas sp. BK580]MBB3693039.1 hypothetical protein [Sphingomonas sp. BK580]
MSRYVTLPRCGWVPSVDPDDHHKAPETHLPDLTVDGPRDPVATGLLDPSGRQLFRLPEPLGFHHPLKD